MNAIEFIKNINTLKDSNLDVICLNTAIMKLCEEYLQPTNKLNKSCVIGCFLTDKQITTALDDSLKESNYEPRRTKIKEIWIDGAKWMRDYIFENNR